MLNQYAADYSTFPVNQRYSHLFQVPGGLPSRSLGMPSRNDRPPSIWDTNGLSGNVFVNPTASSSAPYPQESNPWTSNMSEHTSPHSLQDNVLIPNDFFECIYHVGCAINYHSIINSGLWEFKM